MTLMRKDQFVVTVVMDGTPYGTWDTCTGGEIDSEEKKYKPGGMAAEVSLGGPKTTGNITVSRAQDDLVDSAALPTFRARVGKGQVTITKQQLDVDGNTYGGKETYSGTLKRVKSSDHDSMSGEAAMIELEISCKTIT